ncbi:hypothetical protein QE152_g26466 [Popillia japonica]|uniref:Uncharacterized protein n=1 Tax=Popillia japonica TaxID=7064 RepID=A0AAW1JY55_POPJA
MKQQEVESVVMVKVTYFLSPPCLKGHQPSLNHHQALKRQVLSSEGGTEEYHRDLVCCSFGTLMQAKDTALLLRQHLSHAARKTWPMLQNGYWLRLN